VSLNPPTDPDGPTNFALSTGVDVEWTSLSPPTSLSVFNPSCQTYALYVTWAGDVDLDAGSIGPGNGNVGLDGDLEAGDQE
jgi:hypothetical protein